MKTGFIAAERAVGNPPALGHCGEIALDFTTPTSPFKPAIASLSKADNSAFPSGPWRIEA